jgi:hypothetical protein
MTAAMWYAGPSQRCESAQHVNPNVSSSLFIFNIRLNVVSKDKISMSSASGYLRFGAEPLPLLSLLEEFRYRPSTMLDRHHAPIRCNGKLSGSDSKHLSRGGITPAARRASLAETDEEEDFSLLLLVESSKPAAAEAAAAAGRDTETSTELDVAFAPDVDDFIAFVTSAAAVVAAEIDGLGEDEEE